MSLCHHKVKHHHSYTNHIPKNVGDQLAYFTNPIRHKPCFWCKVYASIEYYQTMSNMVIKRALYFQLKNMSNIDLSNIPRLTPGPVMEIARSCQRLECINISLNSVMNDDCVSYIAQHCRQLKRLYCVSCHVTDKGM